MVRVVLTFLLALAVLAPWSTEASADPCAAEAALQERDAGIPPRLLHAIALAETGRWDADRKASFAWPWTVTAEGEGRFLPTREAAISEVRRLQARGVRNIDVGCMQVNLQHHPNAFSDLEDAFNPRTNVAYAARFLKTLQAESGSWTTAAAHYHSHTPHLAAAYGARVARLWQGGEPSAAIATASVNALAIARREQLRQETLAEREAARQAAEAYRTARMAEYATRRQVALSGR